MVNPFCSYNKDEFQLFLGSARSFITSQRRLLILKLNPWEQGVI